MTWFIHSFKMTRYSAISSNSTTAADMPLSFMITRDQPTDRCRFVDIEHTISFDIDLTIPFRDLADQGINSWRMITLAYNNSSIDGTFDIIGGASKEEVEGSPTYIKNGLSLWPSIDCWDRIRVHSHLYEPNGRHEKYLRITINDPSPRMLADNVKGFIDASFFEIGCLGVEYGIAPFNSAQSSSSIAGGTLAHGLDQEDRIVSAEGGPDFPRWRPIRGVIPFTLRFLGPDASDEYSRTIGQLRRQVGKNRPIMIYTDLENETFQMDRCLYGRLISLDDVSVPNHEHYEVILRVMEML